VSPSQSRNEALHRELSVRTSLPVNCELKGLLSVSVRTTISSMVVRKIIFLRVGGQPALCQLPQSSPPAIEFFLPHRK